MAQLKHLLLKLNFNEKEAGVLLSLIRLGKATAAAVARDSGITRTHIYDLVEALIEKGLVSEVEERGIKTYEAVDHTGLLAYITRRQKELVRLEKVALSAASEFNALQRGQEQKTKVRFFDGVEGVKNIYEEIQTDFKKQSEPFEILTIFSPQNLERLMPGFQYFSFPNAKGRDIVSADPLLPEYERQIQTAGNGVTYKVWSAEKGFFPTDSIAWKNKLAYIDLSTFPSGIIIENEAMHRSFELWFEGLWKGLA